MIPTADQLYDYADRFATRHEMTGQGTVYPTVRQCARRFRCRQADIESVADEHTDKGYLGLATWFTEETAPLGDWMVEAYNTQRDYNAEVRAHLISPRV